MLSERLKKALPIGKDFINYLNSSKSPYHAVYSTVERLKKNGFEKLSEKESWQGKIKKGGKYYFTKNQSTIVAFAVGGKYQAGNGLKIVGAHTDSPGLRLKPVSKKTSHGYHQVTTQYYGGLLAYTWLDRDLGVSGQCIVKTENGFEQKLVEISSPVLKIPSLAIHLDRTVRDKLVLDYEKHLNAILSLVNSTLNESDDKKESSTQSYKFQESHHPHFLTLLAQELNVSVEDIVGFDLCLADTQPSTLGGLNQEFVFSGRLDNLASCYFALEGLTKSLDTIGDDEDIRVICFFDHEECGSTSQNGAGGSTVHETIRRLSKVMATSETPTDAFDTCIKKSFIISADCAHAIHCNYPDKHESNHAPKINEGMVIKVNVNQRYATNSETDFITRSILEKEQLQYQAFVIKQNMGCGSTIGPILSGNCGIRTVDVGTPMLAMHSSRETCGTIDIAEAVTFITSFYNNFRSIDNQIIID